MDNVEKQRVLIESSLVSIGEQYWRLTKNPIYPNGIIHVANSSGELWKLWEQSKTNKDLLSLFFDD